MKVIHDIFSRFFNKFGNVFFLLIQNESPYKIAMVITLNVLGMTTNGKCDTVNNVYSVLNCKYDYLSYPHLHGFIGCYY
jgi:hypothetical protein